MRIASLQVLALALIAIPSAASAQVLRLQSYGYPTGLDHAVPVTTVSLVGDVVELGGARVVHDSYGDPFVLGTATLDRGVPSQPRIVFTIRNASEMPVALKDIVIYERTMRSSPLVPPLREMPVGALYMPLSAAGWGPGEFAGQELEPGASLTVEAPVSPLICGKGACSADGFVVFVGRKLPHADDPVVPGRAWTGDNPLFTRAFLALLSHPRQ